MLSALQRLWAKHTLLFQFGLIFCGLVLALLAVFFFLKLSVANPTTSASEQAPAVIVSAEEQLPTFSDPNPSLDQILTRAKDALGNATTISNLISLRMTGVQTQTSRTFDVTGIYRRPSSMRLHLESNNSLLRIAYNGQRSWRQMAPRDEFARFITDPDATLLARQADSYLVLSQILSQPNRFKLLPGKSVGDHSCVGVAYTSPTGEVQHLYFDTTYYLLRERVIPNLRLAGLGSELTVRYDDYRRVGEIFLHFREESKIEGLPDANLVISSFTLNPGVVSSYFDPPPGTREPNDQPGPTPPTE